ncbi:MAG: hypothetical protein U0L88_08205 [Acutalibacteraceae bacterium]|nr:hypothetical protein [Acutalibacteraceae bacterium]
MAKEKKAESAEPIAVVEEQHEDFVTRKLKAINNMTKPAKAEKLASRLLRKARNN